MSLLACANARSIFESRVVLSALDVLHTGTAVICCCYKTCSFALARNPNLLFHKLFFILVSINCTEALGFVMWSAHSKIYCSQASTRITKLSVGLEEERGRLCNEWKAHVFKKTIRSVGGHVPRAGCACQNRNGIRADEILAGRSRGMEATPAGCPIQRKNCEPPK